MALFTENGKVRRIFVRKAFVSSVMDVEIERGVAELTSVLCSAESDLAFNLPFFRRDVVFVLLGEP